MEQRIYKPAYSFDLTDVHPDARVKSHHANCVIIEVPPEGAPDVDEYMGRRGFIVAAATTIPIDIESHGPAHVGDDAIPPATIEVSGLMTPGDKSKLDAIEPGATANALGAVAAELSAAEGTPGKATEAARADHAHRVRTAVPAGLRCGSKGDEGESSELARADHVHEIESDGPVSIDAREPTEGKAQTFARSDHRHKVVVASPSAIGRKAAMGKLAALSRADHIHPHGELDGGAMHAPASSHSAGFQSAADKTKLDSIDAGATRTALAAGGKPSVVAAVEAEVGIEKAAARSDHQHSTKTGAPSPIGVETDEGDSAALSRADHIHPHGALPGANLHELATHKSPGFMSSADKNKIDLLGRQSFTPQAVQIGYKGPCELMPKYVVDDETGIHALEFSDEEPSSLSMMLAVPRGAQQVCFEFLGRAIAKQGAGVRVAFHLFHREIAVDMDMGRWTAAHEITDVVRIPASSPHFHRGEIVKVLSALQFKPGSLYQVQLARVPEDPLDSLVGPYALVEFAVSWG